MVNIPVILVLFASMELSVFQQPVGQPGYVSRLEGVVTQFQQAKGMAFLAHSYASGRHFDDLVIGDVVTVKMSDNSTREFAVTGIERFRAVEPENEKSDFIDLQSGERLTAAELFEREYRDADRLVLQTCIEMDDEKSWGRLFVVATPHRSNTTGAGPALPISKDEMERDK